MQRKYQFQTQIEPVRSAQFTELLSGLKDTTLKEEIIPRFDRIIKLLNTYKLEVRVKTEVKFAKMIPEDYIISEFKVLLKKCDEVIKADSFDTLPSLDKNAYKMYSVNIHYQLALLYLNKKIEPRIKYIHKALKHSLLAKEQLDIIGTSKDYLMKKEIDINYIIALAHFKLAKSADAEKDAVRKKEHLEATVSALFPLLNRSANPGIAKGLARAYHLDGNYLFAFYFYFCAFFRGGESALDEIKQLLFSEEKSEFQLTLPEKAFHLHLRLRLLANLSCNKNFFHQTVMSFMKEIAQEIKKQYIMACSNEEDQLFEEFCSEIIKKKYYRMPKRKLYSFKF